MKLKVFTLRLDPATGLFDDREVVEFQTDKEVLEVSDYQFTHDRVPTWALLMRYRDAPAAVHGAVQEARKDWRAELDPQAQRLYDQLRLWRGRRSKREGIPPYMILNNRELADVAVRHPQTATALREIQGIGDAKSSRWGDEIIAVLVAAAVERGDAVPAVVEGAPDAG